MNDSIHSWQIYPPNTIVKLQQYYTNATRLNKDCLIQTTLKHEQLLSANELIRGYGMKSSYS